MMLSGVKTSQQCGSAGRAHTGIAEGAVETEAVLFQEREGLEVVLFPVVGEMLCSPFLVGNDHDNVRLAGEIGEAFAEIHSLMVWCEYWNNVHQGTKG